MGEFETKNDLAWDIYHNARVIIKKISKSEEKYHDEWSKQYDFVHNKNRELYNQNK